MNQLLTIKI